MDHDTVYLDGRTLEGGGQLIRIALSVSALTGIPLHLDHIRGNRSGGGGLKAQHLACVQWLAHACNAKLSGVGQGSNSIVFTPDTTQEELSPAFTKKTQKDGSLVYHCRLDIGTAGSTGLALQAILPFILFSKLPSALPVHLVVSGGTDVSGSPSFEYIEHVLLPTLSRIGFPDIKATLGRRGFATGAASIGNFLLEIPPQSRTGLPAFQYRPEGLHSKPQPPSHLRAIFLAPKAIHDHFRKVLHSSISHSFGPNFSCERDNVTLTVEDSRHDKRLYFILVATVPDSPDHDSTASHTLARDWLYNRKVSDPERAATEMAERVTHELASECESGAFVDEHMRDQLVIFQALAEGVSEVFPGWRSGSGAGGEEESEGEERGLRQPSLHARTAEWVAGQLLGVHFTAEGKCEGVGFGAEVESLIKRTRGLDLR